MEQIKARGSFRHTVLIHLQGGKTKKIKQDEAFFFPFLNAMHTSGIILISHC